MVRSKADLNRSLRLVRIADLHTHEETIPEVEITVRDQIAESGSFSWPIIVDEASGLILDGTHRYTVLREQFRARQILVQVNDLVNPGVKIATWWRLYFDMTPVAFQAVVEKHGLRSQPPRGDRRPFHGETLFSFEGRDFVLPGGHDVYDEFQRLRKVEDDLAHEAPGSSRVFEVEEEARPFLGEPRILVIVPPTLTKEYLLSVAATRVFPPKTTRFIYPFRLVGLCVPVEMLQADEDLRDLNRALDEMKRGEICALGSGIRIDRFYHGEFYAYADYHIPRTFFRTEEDYVHYRAKLTDRRNVIA